LDGGQFHPAPYIERGPSKSPIEYTAQFEKEGNHHIDLENVVVYLGETLNHKRSPSHLRTAILDLQRLQKEVYQPDEVEKDRIASI